MGSKPGQKLTPKQKRFVEEYLVDLNGTQAAIRAGYSKKSARNIAKENITKPHISAAITKACARRGERTGITADKVVHEIGKVAFANMEDFVEFGPDGVKLKDSEELSREQLAAVAQVSEHTGKETSSTQFRLHDKLKALELLGRHQGLFNELNIGGTGEVQVSVNIGLDRRQGPKVERQERGT